MPTVTQRRTQGLLRLAGFTLILACGSNGALGKDNRVNVYTSEYFEDLHPLTERTYVSKWISQFTAARLFRRSCVTKSAEYIMKSECVRDGLQVERDRISIEARRQDSSYRCQIPGNVSPRDYIRDSVKRTVELLNDKSLRRNYYFGNGFRMTGNDEYPQLQITYPPNVGTKGDRFLDFPLFAPESSEASKPIPANLAQRLNDMTYGPWKLGTSTNLTVNLNLRGDPSSYVAANENFDATRAVREIRVNSTPESQMETQVIRAGQTGAANADSVANLGHIFLNIGPAFAKVVGDRNYSPAFSTSSGGPFYLGFNFDRSNTDSKGQLFANEEFRRLLALTLWDISVLGDQFSGLSRQDPNMDGIWRGQSLLGILDGAVTRISGEQLRSEIQRFLKGNENNFIEVTLRIWVTPEGERMLDSTGVQRLKAELNKRWRCDEQLCGEHTLGSVVGLFFEFLPESQQRRIPSSDYDLVIDRMVHGDRLTRIADAVTPNDPSNLTSMGDQQVDARRRELWRTETTEAKVDMTRWLKDSYYLIVLGEFQFRDLYYKDMMKAAAASICPESELLPPTGAMLWQAPQ